MSIPAPKTVDDEWIISTFMHELENPECSLPLPVHTDTLQDAAFLRFRVDAILEEWIFSKTGEKIKDLTLREISAGGSTS
tara:strand:- start:2858 stop:3097 length:240 start_codon:yes stop_codon:yes gene_type:complete